MHGFIDGLSMNSLTLFQRIAMGKAVLLCLIMLSGIEGVRA
jgi:hypothetical protein